MENVIKLSNQFEEYGKKQNEFWALQMKAKKEFDEECRKIQETFLRERGIDPSVTFGHCNYYPKQKLVTMRIYGNDAVYVVHLDTAGKLQKVNKSISGELQMKLPELPHCVWEVVMIIQQEFSEKGIQGLSKKLPIYLENSTILYS